MYRLSVFPENTLLNLGLGFSAFQYVMLPFPALSAYITFSLQRRFQWFRSEPESHKARDIALYMHLLEDVKKRIATGICPDCLTAQVLKEKDEGKNKLSEFEIAYAVSTPFGAGIETVS